jgi:hypothetical protein
MAASKLTISPETGWWLKMTLKSYYIMSVEFVWFQKTRDGAKQSAVIALGGSYGGMCLSSQWHFSLRNMN